MNTPKFRLIATGYIIALFFIFLFVFARAEHSAAPDVLVASSVATSATPTPTPASMPVRLIIPKLNLDVAIESKGEDATGHMDVPRWDNAGWFNLGPRPGDAGSSVIAGHYDTPTGEPAIFYNLSALQPGDEVQVVDETSKTLIFRVTDMRNYNYDLFPDNEVFNDSSGHKLNLVTCSGTWNHSLQTYSDRLVVFTELQ